MNTIMIHKVGSIEIGEIRELEHGNYSISIGIRQENSYTDLVLFSKNKSSLIKLEEKKNGS
jgi:hypothetical protein